MTTNPAQDGYVSRDTDDPVTTLVSEKLAMVCALADKSPNTKAKTKGLEYPSSAQVNYRYDNNKRNKIEDEHAFMFRRIVSHSLGSRSG